MPRPYCDVVAEGLAEQIINNAEDLDRDVGDRNYEDAENDLIKIQKNIANAFEAIQICEKSLLPVDQKSADELRLEELGNRMTQYQSGMPFFFSPEYLRRR